MVGWSPTPRRTDYIQKTMKEQAMDRADPFMDRGIL